MRFDKVLVLAPHTDDAELGCGGTIARFLEEGSEVFVAAFSTAAESLPAGWPKDTLEKEFWEAMRTIGVPQGNLVVEEFPVRQFPRLRQEILERLILLRKDIGPDCVLLPNSQDLHQDHATLHQEGTRAFKERTLLGYEMPWNSITFSATAAVCLEQRHLEKKWAALQAYRSQFELGRHYLSKEVMFGLARLRGIQVKTDFAEAFEVSRLKL